VKKYWNRLLSALLCMVMVLGILPVSAVAEGNVTSSNTTNGAYDANGDWSTGGTGTITYHHEVNGTDYPIMLTKTAKEVDENVFEITLKVVTHSKIVKQTAKSAVVLVIDTSNSMRGTPLANAKEAAKNFLTAYAGSDASATKMLAIVTFDSEGRTKMGWANVAGGTGSNSYNAARNVIDNLGTQTGTHMQGGLLVANDLLGSDAIAGIKSKNVVLLSDGAPSRSSGNYSSHEAAAKDAATTVKNIGADLYTIYFHGNYNYHDTSTSSFLKNDIATSTGHAYTAGTANELNNVFIDITEEVEEGIAAGEMTVTDPMGPYIQYIENSASKAGEFSVSGGTGTWKLNSHIHEVDENGETHHEYTITYQVKLNVQGEGFQEGKFYPANAETTINISGTEYKFPVPGVKGYLPRTSVTAKKVWNDDENRDGVRPTSVSLQLMKDGVVYGEAMTLNDKDGWSHTWTDLIKKSEGNVHQYTVVETVNGGEYIPSYEYETTADGIVATVTNTHEIKTTAVTVTKIWADNGNQDGIRPATITLHLLADGEKAAEAVVSSNGENTWTYTFNNLPVNRKGAVNVPIVYTVTEDKVDGYTASEEGLTITNTHTPAKTSATVKKVWNDADDQDGKRPGNLEVTLSNGDQVTLNEANGWTATIENLPVYANGQKITYTWTEAAMPEGYSLTKTETVGTVTTLTNSYTPEVTSATVKKVWDDAENQDGKRPAELKVTLSNGANVELNEANGWTATIENLPVYANGQKITYTWTEGTMPEGYTLTNTEVSGTITTLTNSYKPETTSMTVKKVWDDAENQDGKRPAELKVTLSNGATVALNEANDWTATIDDLPVYAKGQPIIYTWTEGNMPEGYSLTNTSVNGTITTLTNSYTPEVTSATVKKVWDDANNQDGKRPANLIVTLSNGMTETLNEANSWTATITGLPKYAEGKLITYTWGEGKLPAGYSLTKTETTGTVTTLTNSYTPEVTSATVHKVWDDVQNQDGKRPAELKVTLSNGTEITLNEKNNWTATVENLPRYADGVEISYTWTEGEMPVGYSLTDVAKEGTTTTLINSYTPEITSVTVTKKWEDNDDQDGIRPNDITVVLVANGEATESTLVLNEGNDWLGSFTDLDKYAGGTLVNYTVTEKNVAGYEISAINGTAVTGYTITNGHTPATVEVSGSKTWVDDDNQDGKRPESITINLLENGEVIDTKVVTEADGWAWSFENLPKYENHGTVINYSITEAAVEEYTTTYNGYNVTNTHAPEKTSVTVTKSWKDNNDQDGIRPNGITVVLVANGEATKSTLVLNEGNNWTGSFTNLDKYEGGKFVAYTVAEVEVEGYASIITGSHAEGYTITNSHTPATVEVSGSKTWDDNSNQDGKRPASITINLLKNGKVIDTKVVTAEEDWAWSFTNLPKFENHGTLITYSITENVVDEYTTVINGYNVTNTHAPEKTTVTVSKGWEDNNDQDGIRPNDITVVLVANGEATESTLVLNEGNDWTDSFTDLDKYEGGKVVTYTVAEVEVEGYTSVIAGSHAEGYTITNSHTPEVVAVEGSKTWVDADNQDGFRPESITIKLLADGEVIDTIEVTEEDQWAWSFENLPKFKDRGTEIVYSVTEVAVDKYVTEYEGYNVINTHAPEKTSVTVAKTWKDNNDQDGIRPDAVTVKLLANGEDTGVTLELNAENNWTASFADLDKYEAGEEIVYTVAEVEVEGYETVITGDQVEGFHITNTHEPEKTVVAGKKTWDDNNNQDGKRPEVIEINVFGNGVLLETVKVTEAEGWAWSFNLPKYVNGGQEVAYAITENAVEGYTATYEGYNVTNSYTPEETGFSVSKVWADSDDADGIRPDEVEIKLFANGEDTGIVLVLSEETKWVGSINGLPKYWEGEEIVYTVEEVAVKGYNTVIKGTVEEGFTVTNSHVVIPDTGDNRNPVVWISLMAGAVLTAGVALFTKKRKTAK